ncbi:MAG: ABC transporter substrate-binding protein [Agathobacter sp.]|nr:ABC transporter substrate-binding protein [Agathobacter sp.]
MKKKIVSLMLVAAMSISICACGSSSSDNDTETPSTATTEDASAGTEGGSQNANAMEGPDMTAYGDESKAIYDQVFAEFKTEYDKALAATSVSERYALMAVAEAKLLETGIMIPTNSKGGRYGITHVAPYTFDYVLWGTDQTRFHNALVYKELIKVADRDHLVSKWEELKGTGKYLEYAKKYMKDKGYTQVDTYAYPYTGDPETWDVLGSSRATTNEPLSQCVDGLLEYDAEGTLQPALAESYTVSDDGLTYTFKLRKGVKWVDSQGKEVAEVKAKDFVNGFQHMMDTQSGLGDLESGVVVGVTEYIEGKVGIDKVGVKAVDDYTVEYTLVQPCSYFLTTLEYSAYAPLCTEYYESKGGKYGTEYDATCQYGQTKDDIAYCGPYICTAATKEKEMVFSANESYYAPEKRNVSTVKFVLEDGTDQTKAYEDCKSGVISSVALVDATVKLAKKEKLFDEGVVYTAPTDATSYMAFINVNRYATANTNDKTTVVSNRDADDIKKTSTALKNVHARRALCTALDRTKWNAQKNGDDLADKNLINSYTPGNFVALEEDVEVAGLGKFAKGTYYGEIMQAQLDKDGVPITVWKKDKPIQEAGAGYDGWYNAEYAKSEMAKAVEELKAEGVEITKENPLRVDFPYNSADATYANLANAFKQSVEASVDGLIEVNLVKCSDDNQWYYAGYFTQYGWEANYDVYDLSGWGPDYGDPSTYLNTFLPDYAGYMIKCIGIF